MSQDEYCTDIVRPSKKCRRDLNITFQTVADAMRDYHAEPCEDPPCNVVSHFHHWFHLNVFCEVFNDVKGSTMLRLTKVKDSVAFPIHYLRELIRIESVHASTLQVNQDMRVWMNDHYAYTHREDPYGPEWQYMKICALYPETNRICLTRGEFEHLKNLLPLIESSVSRNHEWRGPIALPGLNPPVCQACGEPKLHPQPNVDELTDKLRNL